MIDISVVYGCIVALLACTQALMVVLLRSVGFFTLSPIFGRTAIFGAAGE